MLCKDNEFEGIYILWGWGLKKNITFAKSKLKIIQNRS